MDLTAGTDRGDFRLAACATPIAAAGNSDFQTIDSPANIAFLHPPTVIGTTRIDAPRGAIRPADYFTARFLANTGWKRATLLAVAVEEAPAMRDVVTARMLADPQGAPERAHPRERIGLKLTSRVRHGTGHNADAAIPVTVIDASRGGVCIDTPAQLAIGDVLHLESPHRADGGADFEVRRADPNIRNRYGGHFLDHAAGSALFEQLVEAARAERAARRTRSQADAAPTPESPDRPPTRGMRHR